MTGGEAGSPSWWRRDLLGACRTGEYVEAAPWRDRLRQGLRRLPVAILAIGGLWFAAAWIRRQGLSIEGLEASDPARAGRQAQALLRAVALGGGVVALSVAAVACAFARKVLRAGQWPLPGMLMARRTEILRGWCLRLRFGLPCAALIAAAGLATIAAVKLYGFDGTASRSDGDGWSRVPATETSPQTPRRGRSE